MNESFLWVNCNTSCTVLICYTRSLRDEWIISVSELQYVVYWVDLLHEVIEMNESFLWVSCNTSCTVLICYTRSLRDEWIITMSELQYIVYCVDLLHEVIERWMNHYHEWVAIHHVLYWSVTRGHCCCTVHGSMVLCKRYVAKRPKYHTNILHLFIVLHSVYSSVVVWEISLKAHTSLNTLLYNCITLHCIV